MAEAVAGSRDAASRLCAARGGFYRRPGSSCRGLTDDRGPAVAQPGRRLLERGHEPAGNILARVEPDADDVTLLAQAWPRTEQAMVNRAGGDKVSFQVGEASLLVDAVRRAMRVEVQTADHGLKYVLLFDIDSTRPIESVACRQRSGSSRATRPLRA